MMSNNEFDKGAALSILRYTVKVAVAGAIGGGGGRPPQEGANLPGMPGGGQTTGGSNNLAMQTGWAAGALRKQLVKTFRANAAVKQRQGVHVAAKRTGGMGSGTSGVGGMGTAAVPKMPVPKIKGASVITMASIGGQLEKTAYLPGSFVRAGASIFGKARKAGRVRGALGKLRTGVGQLGTDASALRKGTGIVGKAGTKLDDIVMGARTAPGKGSAYIDPTAGSKFYSPSTWTNPFAKGTGLSNVYKHKETGKLILGPKGYWAARKAPEGYKLHKGFTSTGGLFRRMGKKGLSWGAKGGAGGYAGSYIANPGDWGSVRQALHTIKDPRRLQTMKGGAMFGATAPSLVTPYLLGRNAFTPGVAAATSLATRSGGRWAPGASSGSGIRGALSSHIARTTKQRKISKLEKLRAVAKENKARRLSPQPAPQNPSQALSQTLSSTRALR